MAAVEDARTSEAPDTGDSGVVPQPDAAASPDAAPERDSGLRTSYEWEQIDTPSSDITGRWGILVADRGDQTALIFGGTNTDASRSTVFGDTWLLDARDAAPSFTKLAIDHGPAARYCGCMSWDPGKRRAILVGGRGSNFGDTAPETWVLDPEAPAWERAMVPSTPPGVIGCAMAYSPEKRAMYLFGGASNAAGFVGDTFRLDLDTPAWVKLPAAPPGLSPPARYDAILRCLGRDCRQLVLFGGAAQTRTGAVAYHDIWTFEPSTETWSEVTVGPSVPMPGGRRMPFVAVDPSGTHLVAGFGVRGLDGSGPYRDLWKFDFDSGRWDMLDPMMGPAARGFTLALPGGPNTVGLLLGGFDGQRPVRELWRLWPPSAERWQ